VQIAGGGVRVLVAQDVLDQGHGMPRVEELRGRQVPDGMVAKGLHPGGDAGALQEAAAVHEVLPVPGGLWGHVGEEVTRSTNTARITGS